MDIGNTEEPTKKKKRTEESYLRVPSLKVLPRWEGLYRRDNQEDIGITKNSRTPGVKNGKKRGWGARETRSKTGVLASKSI